MTMNKLLIALVLGLGLAACSNQDQAATAAADAAQAADQAAADAALAGTEAADALADSAEAAADACRAAASGDASACASVGADRSALRGDAAQAAESRAAGDATAEAGRSCRSATGGSCLPDAGFVAEAYAVAAVDAADVAAGAAVCRDTGRRCATGFWSRGDAGRRHAGAQADQSVPLERPEPQGAAACARPGVGYDRLPARQARRRPA